MDQFGKSRVASPRSGLTPQPAMPSRLASPTARARGGRAKPDRAGRAPRTSADRGRVSCRRRSTGRVGPRGGRLRRAAAGCSFAIERGSPASSTLRPKGGGTQACRAARTIRAAAARWRGTAPTGAICVCPCFVDSPNEVSSEASEHPLMSL